MKFTIKANAPFSSDRKMMSIVVKSPTGEYLIYSKGADSVLHNKLRQDNKEDLLDLDLRSS